MRHKDAKTKEMMKAMGKRLKDQRVGAGYTQEGLARLADIPQASLSKYEHGQCMPQLSTAVALCYIIGRPVEWLLSVDDLM